MSCSIDDYGDSYEQFLHPSDQKIAVYDAEDILPLLQNFPLLGERLRGMTVYYYRQYFYLIRTDVWDMGGPELCGIVFAGGDPRCDSYRMSQLTDVGTFAPKLSPPVSNRPSNDPTVPCQ